MDHEAWRTLTQRELEVVQCLVQGLTNHETANHLGLSEDTIKHHLCLIFDKLGVSTRLELLLFYLQAGSEGADAAGILVRKPRDPHSSSGAAAASLDE